MFPLEKQMPMGYNKPLSEEAKRDQPGVPRSYPGYRRQHRPVRKNARHFKASRASLCNWGEPGASHCRAVLGSHVKIALDAAAIFGGLGWNSRQRCQRRQQQHQLSASELDGAEPEFHDVAPSRLRVLTTSVADHLPPRAVHITSVTTIVRSAAAHVHSQCFPLKHFMRRGRSRSAEGNQTE
jgi:hypothetical protein